MVTGKRDAGERSPNAQAGISLPARPVLGARRAGLGPRDVLVAAAVVAILIAGFGLLGGRPTAPLPSLSGSAIAALPTLAAQSSANVDRCSPLATLPPMTLRTASGMVGASLLPVTGSVLSELQAGGPWPDPGEQATIHATPGEGLAVEAGGTCIVASFAQAARLDQAIVPGGPAPEDRLYLGGALDEAAPQVVGIASPPSGAWLVRILLVFGRAPGATELAGAAVFRVNVGDATGSPLVTPHIACGLPPPRPPTVSLSIGDGPPIDGTTTDYDWPGVAPGALGSGLPPEVEVSPTASVHLAIEGDACALTWHIALFGIATLDSSLNPALDPADGAQNRFDLQLADYAGREARLDAFLVFGTGQSTTSWQVRILP